MSNLRTSEYFEVLTILDGYFRVISFLADDIKNLLVVEETSDFSLRDSRYRFGTFECEVIAISTGKYACRLFHNDTKNSENMVEQY